MVRIHSEFKQADADTLVDENFGEWLRRTRLRLGLKADKFNQKSKIPVKRLFEIEKNTGQGVTEQECYKIGMALGISHDTVKDIAAGNRLNEFTELSTQTWGYLSN